MAGEHVNPDALHVGLPQLGLDCMPEGMEAQFALESAPPPESAKPSAKVVAPAVIDPLQVGP